MRKGTFSRWTVRSVVIDSGRIFVGKGYVFHFTSLLNRCNKGAEIKHGPRVVTDL